MDAPTLSQLAEIARGHFNSGRLSEAIAAFQKASAVAPRDAGILVDLGFACRRAGRLDEALDALQHTVEIDPQYVDAWVHLADVLTDLHRFDSSAEAYYRAITLRPDDPAVYARIGDATNDTSQIDALFARCFELIAQSGGSVEMWFQAAFAAQLKGNVDLAIRGYLAALEVDPSHFLARNNLGAAYRDTGQIQLAMDCFRQAADLKPDLTTPHSNFLYAMHFLPACDPVALRREHELWNQQHAAKLSAQMRPHDNDCSPDRRLRIGYVSPNFRQHPVGRFLLAPLACHDHREFEIVCYASVRNPDALTAQLRQSADLWVDALKMSDEALAERIREDRIDILVDLTLHMRDHRLLTFARRPAPIQITYLGYCSTTGLSGIDYRLTDPYLDPIDFAQGGPPGTHDEWYVERSVRLPRTYWCYQPGIATDELSRLPALSRGYVTFGSFNNFCKVSPGALELWAKLLAGIPNSRLILHAHRGQHRNRVVETFATHGISAERLSFVDTLPLTDYFRLYHLVDIALDSFPYAGGTTTCDALWMGVPTVSLVGDAAFARGGLSILSNVGLAELAVGTPEEYLQTAAALAADVPRLSALRGELRDRLLRSPLMDGPSFARDLQNAYRSLWRRWVRSV
jgi:predicted O-linked N-acetylglucosamine transferase (SPINDLY family)